MSALSDPYAIIIIFAALFCGGTLKGALGMGSPVVAVPVMASFVDVRLAVVVMVVPNLITNIAQIRTYKSARMQGTFSMRFALAGAFGAGVGSFALVLFSATVLKIIVACAVLAYVTLRIMRPDFSITLERATALALPFGALSGIFQGAAGVSAPISMSFLNAVKLQRPTVIVTISTLFVAMSAVQIPMLALFGIMTLQTAFMGVFVLLPLFAGMSVGASLAKRMDTKTFDRAILAVLVVLAAKLFWDAGVAAL
jgi:uncharacterized membrane protein YfcA